MFTKRLQIPVWALAAAALAFAGAGAFARSVTAVDNNRIPDLQIAMPQGVDSAGIFLADMNAATADAFGIPNRPGVVVTQVQCGDLYSGDLITAINGTPVTTTRDLLSTAYSVGPGSPLSLVVIRGNSALPLIVSRPTAVLPPGVASLMLNTNPVQPIAVEPAFAGVPGQAPTLPGPALVVSVIRGVQVDNLSAIAIEQLGLPPNTVGILVTGVDANTPAVVAGLRPNDVITEVNSSPVFNVFDYQRAVGAAGANSVTLRVNRRGSVGFVTIPAR
jgi:serine protease Do